MSNTGSGDKKIIDRVLRFPWELIDSTHVWGGTDDKEVITKMLAVSGVSDACLEPLVKNTARFAQIAIPNILMLNNSRNPILAYRNFWRNLPLSREIDRPTDVLGPELTQDEQYTVMRAYKFDAPYRTVFHFAKDKESVDSLASYIVGTAMLTSYVCCLSTTVGNAFDVSRDNSFSQQPLEEFEALRRTPMLVLTDLVDGTKISGDRFEKGYGTLSSLLYDRYHNGRTTVFIDDVAWPLIADPDEGAPRFDMQGIKAITDEWPAILKKYLMDTRTRIHCDLDKKSNKGVWHVSR